jgi:hypothetical protein
MVETITPAVHGGRRRGYAAAVAFHVLGAGLSAAALGVGLGATGRLLGAPWGPAGTGLVALTATLYALREGGLVRVPIWALRRQVPEWWRTFFSPQTSALLYGAGLGVGFGTFLSHGTLVAVSVAAAQSGDPLLGALLCAPFGLTRAMSAVVAGARDPTAAVNRLDELAVMPLARTANGAALAVVAAVALGAL